MPTPLLPPTAPGPKELLLLLLLLLLVVVVILLPAGSTGQSSAQMEMYSLFR